MLIKMDSSQQGQIISLKAENDRMQRIMELKGEISRETNNAESSQKSKLNLGGPTNFGMSLLLKY